MARMQLLPLLALVAGCHWLLPFEAQLPGDVDRATGRVERGPLEARPRDAPRDLRPGEARPCRIDGIDYPAGSAKPNDSCRVCDPTLTPFAWAPAKAGCLVVLTGTPAFTDHVNGPLAAAHFHQPHGLAVAGSLIYVSDEANRCIRRIDLQADDVSDVICSSTAEPIEHPKGLRLAGNLLIVAESPLVGSPSPARLLQIDVDTRELVVLDSSLSAAYDVEILDAGPSSLLVHVADAAAGIYEYAKTARGISFVKKLPLPGARALTHAPGTRWCADQHRVWTYTAGFVPTLIVGNTSCTNLPGNLCLDLPNGLLGDGDRVFVSDTNNDRVLELRAGGTVNALITTGLSDPVGLARLGPYLLVADENNQRIVVTRAPPP